MLANKYSFNVAWSDEDEAFVATCPEFDGVSGFGSTQGAAIKEANAALKLAMETFSEKGWPLPEAKKVSEFSGQFRLRIPKSTHARLARQAEVEGVSLNTLILSLIEHNSGANEMAQKVHKQVQELIATATAQRPIQSAATALAVSPRLSHPMIGGGQWRT